MTHVKVAVQATRVRGGEERGRRWGRRGFVAMHGVLPQPGLDPTRGAEGVVGRCPRRWV